VVVLFLFLLGHIEQIKQLQSLASFKFKVSSVRLTKDLSFLFYSSLFIHWGSGPSSSMIVGALPNAPLIFVKGTNGVVMQHFGLSSLGGVQHISHSIISTHFHFLSSNAVTHHFLLIEDKWHSICWFFSDCIV
jgi:putative effector of murein hydrolase LrgA (UPF0299 family)